MSIAQKPLPTTMMNSILNNRSAMPMKNQTSVNESPFSMSRILLSKTINSHIKIANDPTVKQSKQYYGARNSDASMVTSKLNTLSQGTKNTAGTKLSFQGTKTVNDERQALRRVRSGGAVVPTKKVAKGIPNYPVF